MSALAQPSNPIVEAIEASYNDPELFANVLLRVSRFRKWQTSVCDEIKARLNANETNLRVVVRACRGVGKTFFAAVLLLWWMTTRYNARGLTTAPTDAQIRVLWPEVERLYNRSVMRDLRWGRVLDRKLDYGETWFAVGHSSDNPANLEGHHSDVAAVRIVDEAKTVDDATFDYTAGMLTSPQNLDLWISTPSIQSGRFFERDYMNTDADVIRACVTLEDVLGDPGLTAGERSGLINLRTQILEACGGNEDDPLYLAQVMAQYTDGGEQVAYPPSWINDAVNQGFNIPPAPERPLDIFEKHKQEKLTIGMDVAGSVSGDQSAIAVVGGPDKDGRYEVKFLGSWSEQDTMVSKGKALEALRRFATNYQLIDQPALMPTVRVDTIGIGKGVFDQLRHDGVRAESYRASDKAQNDQRYSNRKASDMWFLRTLLEQRKIRLPNHAMLRAQMAGVKYETTTAGKMRCVDPSDSPDIVDALLCALSPRRVGLESTRFDFA